MTDNTFCRLTIALSLSVLLSACASFGKDTFETPHNDYQLSSTQQLDDRQRADLYEAIIAADLAEHQQDYQTAMSYYLYAADLSKDIQLIKKSVSAATLAKDPLGIQQAAQIWVKVEPENQTARGLILQSQIAQQDGPGALATAKSLLEELATSEQRFAFLESNVLNQDPRVSFNLLRELKGELPGEVAIDTALAKFIMNLANNNKQPENMLKQALQRVDDALLVDKQFVPAIRLKSHVLFQLRRDDDARNYMSQTFNENPDSAEIAQMLGQLLYDLRDFQASAAHYTDWIMNHPKDLDARFYLAASYYAQSRFAEGLKHFEQLVKADYKIDTTAFYCGDSALKTSKTELAVSCLEKVNEGRFWIIARIQLSRIYADGKQYDKALSTLKVANVADNNDKVKLVNAEIDLLVDHFGKAKAKERLQQALLELPDSLLLMLKKIELYELAEKPQELLPLLNQAKSQFEPGAKLDEFNLAAAALLNNYGHGKMALDWLESALESKPDDKELLYTRAIYKEPLGMVDQMLSEFKYLHSLYPDDLNIQNALGYSLADQGKELDLASKLIDEAYLGLPENPAVIDSKGWLAYRLGNFKEAIKYLSTAFQLAPSADIAAHLGEVLWQDDKKELALEVWRKGLALDKNNTILKKTLERFNVEL